MEGQNNASAVPHALAQLHEVSREMYIPESLKKKIKETESFPEKRMSMINNLLPVLAHLISDLIVYVSVEKNDELFVRQTLHLARFYKDINFYMTPDLLVIRNKSQSSTDWESLFADNIKQLRKCYNSIRFMDLPDLFWDKNRNIISDTVHGESLNEFLDQSQYLKDYLSGVVQQRNLVKDNLSIHIRESTWLELFQICVNDISSIHMINEQNKWTNISEKYVEISSNVETFKRVAPRSIVILDILNVPELDRDIFCELIVIWLKCSIKALAAIICNDIRTKLATNFYSRCEKIINIRKGIFDNFFANISRDFICVASERGIRCTKKKWDHGETHENGQKRSIFASARKWEGKFVEYEFAEDLSQSKLFEYFLYSIEKFSNPEYSTSRVNEEIGYGFLTIPTFPKDNFQNREFSILEKSESKRYCWVCLKQIELKPNGSNNQQYLCDHCRELKFL
jgi:hypothetical protein